MAKDTKQRILETAYQLFLERGYDAVSISMLQKEMGIGRATMYHHFTSKQDLFEAIVDLKFRIEEQSGAQYENDDEILSEHLRNRIEKARQTLKNTKNIQAISMLNYYVLSFQALDKIPDLADKSAHIHAEETRNWARVIQNSVNSGEIDQNTDVNLAAELFMNVKHGVSVMASPKISMEETINKIDEMYQYLFALLK